MNLLKYYVNDLIISHCLRHYVEDINFIEIDNDFEFIIDEYNNNLIENRRFGESKRINKNFISKKELEIYSEKKFGENINKNITGICFSDDFIFDNYNLILLNTSIKYLKIKTKDQLKIFNKFKYREFFENIKFLKIECELPCNIKINFINIDKIRIITNFGRIEYFSKVKSIEFCYFDKKIDNIKNCVYKKFKINKNTNNIIVDIRNRNMFLKLCINYEEIKNKIFFVRKTKAIRSYFKINKENNEIKNIKTNIKNLDIKNSDLEIISKSKKIEIDLIKKLNIKKINKIKSLFCKNKVCNKVCFPHSSNNLSDVLKLCPFLTNKIKQYDITIFNIPNIIYEDKKNIISGINFMTNSIKILGFSATFFQSVKITNFPNSLKVLNIIPKFNKCGCGCNFNKNRCQNRRFNRNFLTNENLLSKDRMIIQKIPFNIKEIYLSRHIFNLKIKKFPNNIKKIFIDINKDDKKTYDFKKFILPNNVSKLKINSKEKYKIEDIVDLTNTNLNMLFTENIDISSIKNKYFIKFELKNYYYTIENTSKNNKINKSKYFSKLFSR